MNRFLKERHVTASDIFIYIPIFSLSLSIVYHAQIEIDSFTSLRDVLAKINEFSIMVGVGFVIGVSFSFLSMISTIAVASISKFNLFESFWKFWICHAFITFSLFLLLINHFSEDSDTDISTIDLVYWFVRLCIPYLLSLPLAGVLTIALKDLVSRLRGAGRNQC